MLFNNIMRKLRSKVNPNKVELSPWPSFKDTEPPIEEQFSDLYLHHSTDLCMPAHPKKSPKVQSISPSKLKSSKQKKSFVRFTRIDQQKRSESPIEIKTLAVIKDYCKKFYT